MIKSDMAGTGLGWRGIGQERYDCSKIPYTAIRQIGTALLAAFLYY